MDTSSTAEAEFKTITFGKQIGDHVYFHASLLSALPALFQQTIDAAAALARVQLEEHFNVIKLHRSGEELSLLHYPEFFDDAFPALTRSWRVSLARKSAVYRSYEESRNPPILHRKELLLPSDDPRITEYAALTATAESIGLFADSNRIGFREHWYQLIVERGYQFADGQFIPLANSADAVQDLSIDQSAEIRRHLTALARSNFSAPVQALLRQGLITTETSFFDYGCGRGDDVRGLVANGINASGWDPHYAPDAEKRSAEAVNIGFVINVIEDLDERIEALKGAYACTAGVLSIAAMLSGAAPPEGRQYRDG